MLPAVDILPDEGIPLLGSFNYTSDYEVVHVHCQNKPANSRKRWTIESTSFSDCRVLTNKLFSSVKYEDSVVETLGAFWQNKAQQAKLMLEAENSVTADGIIKYELEPGIDSNSHYICYVVLPGGCCFASPLECSSPVEAQHAAAHISLLNSVLNELPSRRITESFIKTAVCEAEQVQSNGGQALEAYQFVLESTLGQTVLDYTSLVNRLRIMHWCGKLQALNADGATRQDVLRIAQSDHWLSDYCKSAMARHWVAVESRILASGASSSIIKCELDKSLKELHEARRYGHDVTFPRLKRDVLKLAANQLI